MESFDALSADVRYAFSGSKDGEADTSIGVLAGILARYGYIAPKHGFTDYASRLP